MGRQRPASSVGRPMAAPSTDRQIPGIGAPHGRRDEERDRTMSAPQPRDHRRFRLAANDNETVVDDELDVEAHRLAANDNEITVEKVRRIEPEEGDNELDPLGMRRIRYR